MADTAPLSCPSAQPDMADAAVFGVVAGTPAEPRIAYLKRSASVGADLQASISDLEPTDVFRFSARCENGRCAQHAGGRCSLGDRIVALLPPVVDALPSCRIRDTCRWFAENGGAACLRCPQVMTRVPPEQEALGRAASLR